MSLTTQYAAQFSWRSWTRMLDACPIAPCQKILDLGCGTGDISRELAKRGAIVTGIDGDSDLLEAARSKQMVNCTFLEQNLKSLYTDSGRFDGLWCSFVTAYFTDFEAVFADWIAHLKEDSWVCIVDIDNLLGHSPLPPHWTDRIQTFYAHALAKGTYDFNAGHKLQSIIERAGFQTSVLTVDDQELSFTGPASGAVLLAWSQRFDRMGGLKAFLGDEFLAFKADFLACLAAEEHVSSCKVVCCVGRRGCI